MSMGFFGRKRKKILVVDDDPPTCVVLRELLLDQYDVVEAGNGMEALDAVSTEKPDLILLDYEMPGMTGKDVVRILREKAEGAAYRIILVTGRSSLEDVEALLRAGAWRTSKPFFEPGPTTTSQNRSTSPI